MDFSPMTPCCIAHRGASAEAPENTLRAFERALAVGAEGIELDVQVTRDGVAVVFHDSTLTRLTGAQGRIADFTLSEIMEFRIQGEPIPTLADALAATRECAVLQIEIKKDVPVAPVLEAIRRTPSTGQIILASFEISILSEAAALAPHLPRMLIADAPAGIRAPTAVALSLLHTMTSVGGSGISVCHRVIRSPLFVEMVHRHGALLWCWTVNDPRTMRRLRAYGVDGILSDDPAKLVRTLRGNTSGGSGRFVTETAGA